ncbi:MAG TPA: ZIP family metal transporter [Candidatus Limnocylindrales bacterium]|nr:ZIP family metal transporter [Candidatus Limnocylindrales bacterium]
MSTLANILFFTFIGSMAALVGGVVLISKEKLAIKISHFLSSFAAGVLLGTAFFDLLPEALHEGESKGIDVFSWTLFGIILFFLIERTIHWFHHHEDYHEHEKETKSTLPLIIIGDTMHNFIDGVVIAATFIADPRLGVITSLAVFAHELPQEIGDFGLMLHKGMKRKKIILVNILSAAVAFVGAILTYSLGNIIEGYIPIFLSITAGFFIYIATSDIIPEIHYEKRKLHSIFETFLLLGGIGVMWLAVSLLGHGK